MLKAAFAIVSSGHWFPTMLGNPWVRRIAGLVAVAGFPFLIMAIINVTVDDSRKSPKVFQQHYHNTYVTQVIRPNAVDRATARGEDQHNGTANAKRFQTTDGPPTAMYRSAPATAGNGAGTEKGFENSLPSDQADFAYPAQPTAAIPQKTAPRDRTITFPMSSSDTRKDMPTKTIDPDHQILWTQEGQ